MRERVVVVVFELLARGGKEVKAYLCKPMGGWCWAHAPGRRCSYYVKYVREQAIGRAIMLGTHELETVGCWVHYL
ncbi:unnamed protein product, partial [Dovyalis caffra]